MGDQYLGVIEALGFQFVPRSFGACAGAIIAISQNQSLFSLLGTAFGGDGRVSFGLPEMRGRIPMGYGTGPGLPTRVMGQIVGSEDVTLVAANLPAHTHGHTYSGGGGGAPATVQVASSGGGKKQLPDDGDFIAAPGNALGIPQDNLFLAPGDVTTTALLGGVSGGGGGFDSAAFAIQAAGQNVPFPIVQPSQAINFCICTQGLYPSRS